MLKCYKASYSNAVFNSSDDKTLLLTFPSTDNNEASPTIQDGGRQTGSSPQCIIAVYSGLNIELHIDLDEITGKSILLCDGDP